MPAGMFRLARIVRTCSEHKLEAQNKIAIFPFRKEIATAFGRAHDLVVLHGVAGAVTADESPPLQSLSVEQRSETGLVCRESDLKGQKQRNSNPVRRGIFFEDRKGVMLTPSRERI
jgi:hypothetical protein